jgi:hypothetical protein
VENLTESQFQPLKEEIDMLRGNLGLDPLPSLQQESEAVLTRYVPITLCEENMECLLKVLIPNSYLEKRRREWKEDSKQQKKRKKK